MERITVEDLNLSQKIKNKIEKISIIGTEKFYNFDSFKSFVKNRKNIFNDRTVYRYYKRYLDNFFIYQVKEYNHFQEDKTIWNWFHFSKINVFPESWGVVVIVELKENKNLKREEEYKLIEEIKKQLTK